MSGDTLRTKIFRARQFQAFLIIMFLLVSFSSFAAERELPVMDLTLGAKKVVVEIAASESDSAQGLMGRKFMPKNRGMLFIFKAERKASFWMKNCLIPLDIAYIDRSGKILQIEQMEVPKPGKELDHYRSKAPVRYALEMNAGWFEKNKVTVGTVIPELAPH